MNFLGIDTGTGGTRAVVVNEAGDIVASAISEHKAFASPNIGWAEQDAGDWWRACGEAVQQVLTEVRAEDIACIGLSGQMHGATLLDKNGEVLRPAIIWCDGRTTFQCHTLTEKIGAQKLIELVSNPALEGFTLPKMLWVRDHEPQVWQRTEKVLLPKDYIRFRLSGEYATDVADASGTLLLDVAHRRWSGEMFALTGIEESMLPPVYESPHVSAKVSKAGAAHTGLRQGTPIVAGAGDQAAGAVGLGIVKAGAVSATIGTSGVVFAATDKPAIDDARGRVHTFCHAVPERWHVMGVTQAAGLSLRWFRETFGVKDDDVKQGDNSDKNRQPRDAYERLMDEAASAPVGSAGVIWTPYLMGERTPHLDPNARAALIGLTASHTRAHIIRAMLEGVAFSLKDTFEIFRAMNVPVESIVLGGGGARSKLWRQIQADVYAHAVERPVSEEGAAYGAALLAGVGGGAWVSVDEACAQVARSGERLEPEPKAIEILNERYQVYRKLYDALRFANQDLQAKPQTAN